MDKQGVTDMARISKDKLINLLTRMATNIRNDDSLEGSIEYESIGDEFEVAAFVREGNYDDQGSCIHIKKSEDEEMNPPEIPDSFGPASDLVTCKHCGWVHFAVTREYAGKEVYKFNSWYNQQTDETKSCYGGPSSIESYDKCMRCGGSYKNFRDTIPEEYPRGSTINPILHYNEE